MRLLIVNWSSNEHRVVWTFHHALLDGRSFPLVLREVFGFGFPEVAAAVGRSEAACRQLAARARRHMDGGQARFEAARTERDELAARFFDALLGGDVDGLQELLAADVQMIGDGGGKAPAFARITATYGSTKDPVMKTHMNQ